MAGPYGAASEYVAKRFGGNFRVRESVVAVGVAAVNAAPNDPDRVALIIVNIGATTITLGFHQPVVASQGILLLDNGSSYSVNVEQDSIIPAWPHFAIGSAGGGSLFVVETILEGR